MDAWLKIDQRCYIQAAKRLIAAAGSLRPARLSEAEIIEVVHGYETAGYAHSSKVLLSRTLRHILRNLWEHHGAPKLDESVPTYAGVRPRNVTATHEEVDAIMAAAPPALHLWLLLCSDLAMRSGAANLLRPENYDQQAGIIRFLTKGQARQTLPVTAEIRAILDQLDQRSKVPFVWQLRVKQYNTRKPTIYDRKGFYIELRQICKVLGITKRIIPHDLRRTTAVAMMCATHDLRDVKALLGHSDLKTTLWYLDHDNTPVDRKLLEAIKRPYLIRKEVSA